MQCLAQLTTMRWRTFLLWKVGIWADLLGSSTSILLQHFHTSAFFPQVPLKGPMTLTRKPILKGKHILVTTPWEMHNNNMESGKGSRMRPNKTWTPSDTSIAPRVKPDTKSGFLWALNFNRNQKPIALLVRLALGLPKWVTCCGETGMLKVTNRWPPCSHWSAWQERILLHNGRNAIALSPTRIHTRKEFKGTWPAETCLVKAYNRNCHWRLSSWRICDCTYYQKIVLTDRAK